MTRPAETVIAAAAADWLEGEGFEVYEEVQTLYGGRADLVGVAGAVKVIVETKTSWSIDLLYQCARWSDSGLGSQIYACAPATESMDAVRTIARRLGVGLLKYVDPSDERRWGWSGVRLLERAPFRRGPRIATPPECLRGVRVQAGSNGGGHWTPYLRTCAQLRSWVAHNPGGVIADAVRGIQHHYSNHKSAKAVIPQRIIEGSVPGVELRFVDGKWRLYPTPHQSASPLARTTERSTP